LNDDKNALNRTFSVVIGDDAGLSSNRAGQSLQNDEDRLKLSEWEILAKDHPAQSSQTT